MSANMRRAIASKSKGPALRLLMVCDDCGHLYNRRCRHGKKWGAAGERLPARYEGDGRYTHQTPSWCPLRAPVDAALPIINDAMKAVLPGPMAEPEEAAK